MLQQSKLKIIEQIIEEWIYCYPSRTLSQEKIEILKEQHYQNLKDDMRGVVSGIVSAPEWIYCYPNRNLSKEKIEILKEQHYQNLRDDMRGVVSGIILHQHRFVGRLTWKKGRSGS